MLIRAVATLLTLASGFCCAQTDRSTNAKIPIGETFQASDSFRELRDDRPDAQECLNGLQWEPEAFTVTCQPSDRGLVDAYVRFASARPTGHVQNDSVYLEWYAVNSPDGTLRDAPAILVVHESGRGMTVGRMISRGLRDRGIHAFMVQLPFYGNRRPADVTAADQKFQVVMEQGIADVRRARDAIAVMPGVRPDMICLQGTSLGGFVSATTAGLDCAFQGVFILLAGGDLPKLIATGERETAQLKAMLAKQGFAGEQMQELLNRFEPNRLAHRISADRLWLFSALYDTTVPPVHADSFAKAASLAPDHHIRMPANHYSGVIFLPMVLDQIAEQSGGNALLKK